jgi:hypothetical protein
MPPNQTPEVRGEFQELEGHAGSRGVVRVCLGRHIGDRLHDLCGWILDDDNGNLTLFDRDGYSVICSWNDCLSALCIFLKEEESVNKYLRLGRSIVTGLLIAWAIIFGLSVMVNLGFFLASVARGFTYATISVVSFVLGMVTWEILRNK